MKRFLIYLCAAVTLLCSCSGNRVKILAHRGFCSENGSFVTDENTLDALRRAQQQKGLGAVEFDVHLTADEQIVIRHDNKIAGKLSCQGNTLEEIRAYTLPFGNKIPTLKEWLEQAKQTPELIQILEIKAQSNQERENLMVAKCVEMIKALDMVDQVVFVSFNAASLDEAMRLSPESKTILNSTDLHNSLTPSEVKACGYSGISYRMDVILNHQEWIKEFKDLGIDTYLWMVNSKDARKIAEKLGFTWVTTDFYDLISY